jgi:hypothetical protein
VVVGGGVTGRAAAVGGVTGGAEPSRLAASVAGAEVVFVTGAGGGGGGGGVRDSMTDGGRSPTRAVGVVPGVVGDLVGAGADDVPGGAGPDREEVSEGGAGVAGGGDGGTGTTVVAFPCAPSMPVGSGLLSAALKASNFVASDVAASVFKAPGLVVAPLADSGLPAGFGSGVTGSSRSVATPRRAFSRFNASRIRASCASTSA